LGIAAITSIAFSASSGFLGVSLAHSDFVLFSVLFHPFASASFIRSA